MGRQGASLGSGYSNITCLTAQALISRGENISIDNGENGLLEMAILAAFEQPIRRPPLIGERSQKEESSWQ